MLRKSRRSLSSISSTGEKLSYHSLEHYFESIFLIIQCSKTYFTHFNRVFDVSEYRIKVIRIQAVLKSKYEFSYNNLYIIVNRVAAE